MNPVRRIARKESGYRWECSECESYDTTGGARARRDAEAQAHDHALEEGHEVTVLRFTCDFIPREEETP